MQLNLDEYRSKVLGCWIGKNIGGTVGAPFEWKRQVNDIDYYPQKDLDGTPMPNDDLDIQLLWLCALEERGLEVNAHRLAEYWVTYVSPHWNEYGIAKINMRQGLQPPVSGTFGNPYKHSCGSYIRSEIWACIAPGMPQVAARYAYEDAILDHGDGEGVFAELFMAALESSAFVVGDLRKLIDIGLSYIPADCGVAKAIGTTLDCFDAGKTWLEARDEILRHHRGRNRGASPRDQELGFADGVLGYDVPSNIAITLVGLLWGGDDFGSVQCTAVNCGEDTDCTAATAGSVWGIIHGADAIPQRWIDPIGRGIRTVCLNLGDLGFFGNQLPQSVDELTDRTIHQARQLMLKEKADHVGDAPTDLSSLNADTLKAQDHGKTIWAGMTGVRHDFDFFTVHVDSGDPAIIRPGEPKDVTITIVNRYKTQANLSLHWYLPDGWQVSPAATGYALSLQRHFGEFRQTYTFTAETLTGSTLRAVLEITIAGRPTAMLVPLALLNGSLIAETAGQAAPPD